MRFFINHVLLKYAIQAVGAEIVFWTQWTVLGEKLLFWEPLKIHSWRKAARAGRCVIGLAQERGHVS